MIVTGRYADVAYDLAVPEGAVDGATVAVLLHGRGSHKGDLQALGPVLPPDWVLVTPQAPNPAALWGFGDGWAWYRYLAEDRLDHETLERSLRALDGFLAGLPEVVGLAPGRVVLGGFSQGGTTSLAYTLTRRPELAATWMFSGFLPDSIELPEGASWRETPPVFWGHGVQDPNVPIHLARRGRAKLEEIGVRIAWQDYPIGHWMVPEEVHAAVALLDAQRSGASPA